MSQNTEQKNTSSLSQQGWFTAAQDAAPKSNGPRDTGTEPSLAEHVSHTLRSVTEQLERAANNSSPPTFFSDTNTNKGEISLLAKEARLAIMKALCEHPEAAAALMVDNTTANTHSPAPSFSMGR